MLKRRTAVLRRRTSVVHRQAVVSLPHARRALAVLFMEIIRLSTMDLPCSGLRVGGRLIRDGRGTQEGESSREEEGNPNQKFTEGVECSVDGDLRRRAIAYPLHARRRVFSVLSVTTVRLLIMDHPRSGTTIAIHAIGWERMNLWHQATIGRKATLCRHTTLWV